MKKKVLLVVTIAIAVFLLTACGKFTCDVCGEEKSGTCHKEEILGVEVEICDDCYKSLEKLSDAVGDTWDDLGDSLGDSLDDLSDYVDDNWDDIGDAVGDGLEDLADYFK